MDVQSRAHWVDYSKAKDEMFRHTGTEHAPSYVVDANCERKARLNTIHHLLELIPCREVSCPDVTLPERQTTHRYKRPPKDSQRWVPEVY